MDADLGTLATALHVRIDDASRACAFTHDGVMRGRTPPSKLTGIGPWSTYHRLDAIYSRWCERIVASGRCDGRSSVFVGKQRGACLGRELDDGDDW